MFGACLSEYGFVVCVVGLGLIGFFEVGTMVDEGSDLHSIGKLRDSAYVIGVVVRNDDIVDLPQSSQLHRGFDAARISALKTRPACIDE